MLTAVPYPRSRMTFIRYFGKFLISVGVGILLFVLWTLKGTDLLADRQQDRLAEEFARLPSIQALGGSPRLLPPDDLSPAPGDPVFRIVIPKIDVRKIVVEGVDTGSLRMGPGHYPACGADFDPPLCLPDTFFPGEPGMAIVSGHRTTYGAPFWDLDKLEQGDEIRIEAKWGIFVFEVTKTEVVPDETPVFAPAGEAQLLLTTCNPRFSADERLLVRASLTGSEPPV